MCFIFEVLYTFILLTFCPIINYDLLMLLIFINSTCYPNPNLLISTSVNNFLLYPVSYNIPKSCWLRPYDKNAIINIYFFIIKVCTQIMILFSNTWIDYSRQYYCRSLSYCNPIKDWKDICMVGAALSTLTIRTFIIMTDVLSNLLSTYKTLNVTSICLLIFKIR